VRLALIGCGAIARRSHLPAFKKIGDVDVVAFASRSHSSAEAAQSEWGSGLVVDDWRKVLDEDIDAIDICAPNAFHAQMAISAAERGKHVLVEKPMATSVADADAMVAAALRNNVVLMPSQNVRFAGPFVAAAQLVASGRLGRVVGLRAAFGHSGPQDWAPDASWFFDPALAGGGALLDLGIHMIDVLRAVVGEDIVEVSAMVNRRPEGVDEAAQVLMRFGGGAIGTLHASWIARPGPDHQLTVFGTDGRMHLDSRSPLKFFPVAGDAETVEMPTSSDSPYAAFRRAVDDGETPPVTGAHGRAAVAVACAAYEAADSGRLVTVS
jgi:UDP-N-acetylglucosamine 3-dehydrogenase